VDAPPARAPLRVLLDSRGRVTSAGPLFDPDLGPTLVVTTEAARAGAVDAWRASGAKVEVVPPGASGFGVDLDATFTILGREGVLQALVEGGGELLGAVIEAGAAQRIVAYVAPLVLGADGRPAFDFPGPRTIRDAPRWQLVDVARVGADVRLELEPGPER
jgi:diaminohydroxyphosphoribosylaminopyrimidine deaminase / 5-amino-6-(5-phosphoribosylamino)uracil reductase